MINRTEADIMKNWQGDEPVVTIVCTAYNQEKYIEKCLDGFLMQETDFPFVIFVHDDASTDATPSLIRKYEQKYPHLFDVVYEEENQYSKGNGTLKKIVDAHLVGEYVAVCEGDDYWCDANKLQLQYNIMKKYPNCSMCVHDTLKHHLTVDEKDSRFKGIDNDYKLDEKEIFFGWTIHTSSYFYVRKMHKLSSKFPYWFGDYVMLTLAYYLGDIYYIGKLMSVYNMDNPYGVTTHVGRLELDKKINKILQRAQYLREYDKFSEFRFTKIVNERISEIECSCDITLLCAGIGDRRAIYNRLTTNSFYKALGYFNTLHIKVVFSYYCPFFYNKLRNIYHLFEGKQH